MKVLDPKYKTFWRRFWAGCIDGIFLFILFAIIAVVTKIFIGEVDEEAVIITVIIHTAISFIYSVWMTGKFGVTVGKMVMKIQVLDGAEEKYIIGYKRAFYRDSIPIILDTIAILYILYEWEVNRNIATDRQNVVLGFIKNSSDIWLIAELLTMFGNGRRRAIHDILANSVVVKLSEKDLKEASA